MIERGVERNEEKKLVNRNRHAVSLMRLDMCVGKNGIQLKLSMIREMTQKKLKQKKNMK